MTKTFLKQLVAASYTKDVLDEKNVTRIANALKRSELKQYIRALKLAEKRRTVLIESAFPLDKQEQQDMKYLFANKHVVFGTDPALLVGIKVTNNDNIYQMNLQHNLATISSHITEGYDRR